MVLQSAGYDDVQLHMVHAHNRLIGEEQFLKSEGIGIPAKLVNAGYLPSSTLSTIAKDWSKLLKHQDRVIFRQLFMCWGKKNVDLLIDSETLKQRELKPLDAEQDSGINVAKTRKSPSQIIRSARPDIQALKGVLQSLLSLDEDIAPTTSFAELGINSYLSVEFIEKINDQFDLNMGVEAIFDHDNLAELLTHIDTLVITQRDDNAVVSSGASEAEQLEFSDGIAIIGMSGRFPDANSVDEYWKNLLAGKSCIHPISRRNWRESSYYSQDNERENTSVSKWGGFLDEIYGFDPLFFNISPKEASRMDPQQRLFLEETYKCFADAGYSPQSLSAKAVGVYVGSRQSSYLDNIKQYNAHSFLGNDSAILAARISYYLNLKGPSLAVDTACSSALVAVHLACQSLQQGESELALAGGVFALTSPEFYVMASKTNMLSERGVCRTFDDEADGIVPGESVACILLKPTSKALADGDYIYAQIRGTAVNQDGKTKGITAPSSRSQTELINALYERTEIEKHSVGYIELHGTGTKLGDPIEVKALQNAFAGVTSPCLIGSHKPNIGHTITAAGMTGLIKVILALKHKTIPPTIGINKLNRHITLSDSCFEVNSQVAPWPEKEEGIRRAAISSFGFSGTNAHAILEQAPDILSTPKVDQQGQYLIALSANSEQQLKEYVSKVVDKLTQYPEYELADLSFTLLVGRVHHPHRLACLVADMDELVDHLKQWLNSSNEVHTNDLSSAYIEDEHTAQDEILSWYSNFSEQPLWQWNKDDVQQLAKLYLNGTVLPFHALSESGIYRRLSLPCQPFNQQLFFVDNNDKTTCSATSVVAQIHPLVHKNCSTLAEQSYRTTLSAEQSVLSDHIVLGQRILPGAAYLEIARVALADALSLSALEQQHLTLHDVVWQTPFVVAPKSTAQLKLVLLPEESQYSFTVMNESDTTLCHGMLQQQSTTSEPTTDTLQAIQARCNATPSSGAEYYRQFGQLGFEYGPSHQGITRVWHGAGEVLSELDLSAHTDVSGDSKYILPPGLLDSALQSCLCLHLQQGGTGALVPFHLQSLSQWQPVSAKMWVWVRTEAAHTGVFTICMFNEQGQLCVMLSGLQTRTLGSANTLQSYTSLWQPATNHISEHVLAEQVQVWGCELPTRTLQTLQAAIPTLRVLNTLQGEEVDRYEDYVKSILTQLSDTLRLGNASQAMSHQILVPEGAQSLQAMLVGMFRSVQQEYPGVRFQVIGMDEVRGDVGQQLGAWWLHSGHWLRSVAGELESHSWVAQALPEEAMTLTLSGCYVISGGAGGLGRLFGQSLASRYPGIQLALLGRRGADAEIESYLADLREQGAEASYYQVDVTDTQAVKATLAEIRHRQGAVKGIIHSAGLLRDGLLRQKQAADIRAVFGVKAQGLVNLDEASQDDDLAFFVGFSSMAGVIGNVGQTDYAAANGFVDGYLRERAKRGGKGKSLALAWPLWQAGGMQVDEVGLAALERQGLAAMPTELGLDCFYRALQGTQSHVAILYGQHAMTQQIINKASVPVHSSTEQTAPIVLSKAVIDHYLQQVFSDALMLPVQTIELDAGFEKFGIDSVMVLKLTGELEKRFGSLPKTLLFEYQTIAQLSEYLSAYHSHKLAQILKVSAHTTTHENAVIIPNVQHESVLNMKDDVVAVIGLSGKYPGANNMTEFWSNLENGIDSVGDIPVSRWDNSSFYDPTRSELGKIYSNSGGFIDGVYNFDPLFFNMSPREAEVLDPQERLFLQTAYHTLEDAGYTAQALADAKVGVYVGVMYEEYILHGQFDTQGQSVATTGNPASIANRVSHYFNFHGPSLALDTMCSSSLTTIHLAC
ncbi:MAG: SDR family NAD(P)-dependent oxidoreductase, partial [Gammaproteobacteria bacterium]|nr:SDR family NAD(P)-dependent oxidoreductase [Gammaproteobacteria bacterium]